MAKTPESKVKAEIKAALEAEGLVSFADFVAGKGARNPVGFFFMPVAGRFSVLGIHDFVGCWNGKFFSIETKAPDNPKDCTLHQEEFHKVASLTGGVSFVGVRSGSAVQQIKQMVEAAHG